MEVELFVGLVGVKGRLRDMDGMVKIIGLNNVLIWLNGLNGFSENIEVNVVDILDRWVWFVWCIVFFIMCFDVYLFLNILNCWRMCNCLF